MCCDTGSKSRHAMTSCCCGPQSFGRRFYSKKEKRQCLEEYRADLQREIEALEEAIKKLQKD